MRLPRLIAGLGLFLSAAAPAPAADPSAEIRATLEQWTEDFNAGRAETVCGLFAEELVAEFRGQPQRGNEELCDLLQRSLKDPARDYKYGLEIKEIVPAGDLAVVRLDWTLHISPLNVTSVEPGMDLFRRQPDGSWKIIRYLGFEAP